MEHAVEAIFEELIDEVVLATLVTEEARAHHGRGGERDEQGNADGHAEDHRKFAEQAADDAAHHENGNEDGHERGAHGKNGEADLARTFQGGFKRGHTIFDVAGDVLHHDDGIVDDESGADGQGHQRKIVETVVAQVHDAKSADEGKRDGDAGNNGGAHITKESENHQDDQNDRDDESDLDVVHGSADGGAAIDSDTQMQRRGDRGAKNGEQGGDAVDGLDHVGAGLAEDSQEHAALSAGKAEVANVGNGIDDLSDVAEAHGSAFISGDNEWLILVGLEELVGVGNVPGPAGIADAAF